MLPSNYGNQKNQISPWIYAIWTLLNIGFMGLAAFKYHNSAIGWIVSLLIFGSGIGLLIRQIAKDGDTTLAPYAIQTIGVIAFWITAVV